MHTKTTSSNASRAARARQSIKAKRLRGRKSGGGDDDDDYDYDYDYEQSGQPYRPRLSHLSSAALSISAMNSRTKRFEPVLEPFACALEARQPRPREVELSVRGASYGRGREG